MKLINTLSWLVIIIIIYLFPSCTTTRFGYDVLIFKSKRNGREITYREGEKVKIVTTDGRILKGPFEIINDSSLIIVFDTIRLNDISQLTNPSLRGAAAGCLLIGAISTGGGVVAIRSSEAPGEKAAGITLTTLGAILSLSGITGATQTKQFTNNKWYFDIQLRDSLYYTKEEVKNRSFVTNLIKAYDDLINQLIKNDVFENEISKYGLQDGDTLVDIGCGVGIMDVLISHYYPNTFFLLEDIVSFEEGFNRSFVIEGQEINFRDKYKFVLGTDDSIPLPSSAYKVILCRLTVHEFTNRSSMVKELKRIITPNGLLIIVDDLNHAGRKDNTGLRNPSKDEIIELFTVYGFNLISETEILKYSIYNSKMTILKFTKQH